jgi:hypothetical protein
MALSRSAAYSVTRNVSIEDALMFQITMLCVLLFAGALRLESAAQPKGRTAQVQGILKSRIELKNTKNILIEILADGEETPRKYGVPYLPKEKGPIAGVLPAVHAARLGDRVRCDLVYGAHGYESGFTVVSFEVLKKADTKGKSPAPR